MGDPPVSDEDPGARLADDSDESLPVSPEGEDAAEPPSAPSAADVPAENDLQAQIMAGFDRLMEVFEARISYDRVKEDHLTRLHSELQEHKQDLLARASLPLVNAVIRLHDDLGKAADGYSRATEPVAPADVQTLLADFQADVEILLADNGVTSYRTTEDVFDGGRQQALRVVPTGSLEADGTIQERIRCGFERTDHIVRKEKVAVGRYRPADTAPDPVNADPSDSVSKGSP